MIEITAQEEKALRSRFGELLAMMDSATAEDTSLAQRAFEYALNAHRFHRRFSGDPYLTHALETGVTLAEIGMDGSVISAGLLHDVLEDTAITPDDLRKEFGKEIAFLVEGVTKIGKYQYQGVERHAESLRKFLIATSKDLRVITIKLADRLHNMRTLSHVRDDKQKRIALETLEIYAPLANRLGMGQIKGELEDLAFSYVYPKEYRETLAVHREKSKDATRRLEKLYRALHAELVKSGVTLVSFDYRVKRLYSLYKKLKEHDADIEKIYDISALRIVVPTIADCYQTLGIVHAHWTPLPGRIKDYIATPKLNGYQSLHTTIFTGDGGIVEVQVRTEEMHRIAEYGIAAHISYKEGVAVPKNATLKKNLRWIEEFLLWQKTVRESGEFLEHLKTDVFRDRVFVFTPKGDVVDLPEESCPVDFAFSIHTDIGIHTAGAKINNKMSPLDTKLKNGDIVEIIVKRAGEPSPKWLDFLKTSFARKRVGAYLQNKNKKKFEVASGAKQRTK